MTQPPTHRFYIFGASGSGTTTLGAAVAQRMGVLHLESDDFYWVDCPQQPYTHKRPPAERVARMQAQLQGQHSWVISGGSLADWGQPLVAQCTQAVWVHLPAADRMARLHAREQARFGDRLHSDAALQQHHREFLAWAARYDTEPATSGTRNLLRHRAWMAQLHCPVLALDSRQPVAQLVDAVLAALHAA